MLMTGIRKLKSSCKPSTWSHYFRTEQKLKRELKYSSFDICSSSLPKRAHSIVSEREMNLIKVEKHVLFCFQILLPAIHSENRMMIKFC